MFVERLSELDAPVMFADLHGPVDADIAHFLRIFGAITPPGNSTQHPSLLSARTVDEIIDQSKFIGRLRRRAPEITVGPVLRTDQYWVSTGRPMGMAARKSVLDRAHFVEPAGVQELPASTKPFNIGLYTSTAAFHTFGMWWCYLQLNAGSTLFPRPWRVWSLKADPDAAVLEIATAAKWVEFVLADAIHEEGLLYPNWKRAAERWDGIHMTVNAVAATQGMCFSDGGGHVVAPPYWDVESTLWLRWIFTAVELIESLDVGVGMSTSVVEQIDALGSELGSTSDRDSELLA